jgi:hypothetical protein
MAGSPVDSVTLHSSWRGIVGNALGALLVWGGGILGVSVGGWRPLPTFVFVLGLLLMAVVALDHPVASTFTAQGVTRRMMLRRQHLAWERVGQLSRTRPALTAGWRKVAHGGLVAVVGRRRYLLVDHCESADEFERVEEVVGDQRERLLDAVPRPTAQTGPTWLYRRARWAPDGEQDR